MVMSALGEWVTLLPVLMGAMSGEDGDGKSSQQLVSDMLKQPHLYVPGLPENIGLAE